MSALLLYFLFALIDSGVYLVHAPQEWPEELFCLLLISEKRVGKIIDGQELSLALCRQYDYQHPGANRLAIAQTHYEMMTYAYRAACRWRTHQDRLRNIRLWLVNGGIEFR